MNIEEFRAEKNAFFKKDQQSPLTPEQQNEFDGLKYFAPDNALRFELEIKEFDDKQQILMATSTGDVQNYIRFGKITFEVEGETAQLTVFSSQHGFFIPFVDSQAGKETYGAGRYLDPHQTESGKLEVDFNLAYNPYCAYNDLYSCPIPPAENRLNIPIKAGEKNFK